MDLTRRAGEELEAGAVLIAGVARTASGVRLLAREVAWVPPEAYLQRRHDGLTITSNGYVPALARAEALGSAAIWLHTHPGVDADPSPSRHDDVVDTELAETFKIRTGRDLYGSLVISPARKHFAFTGRGHDLDEPFRIDRTLIVGDRLDLVTARDIEAARELPLIFDRQVRAFGGEVQEVLAQLRVSIVGCGGTGSAVAEQLVRLGVRSLTLVDHDTLSDTNVTRVYGSFPDQVGKSKTEVLGEHLRRIAPDLQLRTYSASVLDQAVARAIAASDVIFGCTDDNAGRLVLSRVAAYYLATLIDCGVLITSHDGTIEGIDGRVTVQSPGAACLVCRHRIDMARAAAEVLDPEERQLREDEGYAPELGRVEPAVVTFTTLVASHAVTELLERLVGFGPEPVPTELLLRSHEREISTNVAAPVPGHFCDPTSGLLGTGDSEPFLGQLWRSP
ncbi:MAG: ThiF family adenylyltransferase [Acidimicrobiia bacterium]|nr:ThiF family adenylyltransferase [Acidimicrobiia bacterium]